MSWLHGMNIRAAMAKLDGSMMCVRRRSHVVAAFMSRVAILLVVVLTIVLVIVGGLLGVFARGRDGSEPLGP